MDSNASKPPKRFWNLPLYLGRAALFLAIVPMAMLVLCIVTGNTVISLIDLYYWFVTPLQICKWSILLALIFSFLTTFSASVVYYVKDKLYWDEYSAATRLSSRALILVVAEVLLYYFFRS